MGDSLDIHSLLENGYFTTTRAKTGPTSGSHVTDSFVNDLAGQGLRQSLQGASPTSPKPDPVPDSVRQHEVPRTYDEPRERQVHTEATQSIPRRVYLPPPTVEDEAESLAKEHGAPFTSEHPEEKPQSRGEFQQESIMEEVHEHNPERRFVVVTGQPKSESSNSENDARQQAQQQERKQYRRSTTNETLPDSKPERRSEPSYEPVFDDRHESGGTVPVLSRRRSERRKSRNELPRIDTSAHAESPSGRPRTKSAVGGSRPDFFDPGRSRQNPDAMLSPEVIKHGSGRREQPYHGYGSSDSPGGRPSYPRSLSNSTDDRYMEGREHGRVGMNPILPKRTGPNHSSGGKDGRHFAPERGIEPRSRDSIPPQNNSRREGPKSHGRPDEPAYRGVSSGQSRESRPRREDSRSSDERSRDSRISTRRRRDSVVIQDERRSLPNLVNGTSNSSAIRPSPRGTHLPLASPRISVPSEISSTDGRQGLTSSAGAAGVAVLGANALNGRKTVLPYPEEDYLTHTPAPAMHNITRAHLDPTTQPDPLGNTPLASPVAEVSSEPRTSIIEPSLVATPQSSSQPWEPGSFVPERDGLPVEKPMGSYRRYSENVDSGSSGGPPKLPECRFTKAVTGVQNWLTLPRSEFNICAECFTAVFADTDYRTQFFPMLYPADKAVACDFGSSPWYRIAWLLTLRNETPDLRLFYAISEIATVRRGEPCPGDRKALRNWLTIIDPYTRRPIPKFSVCVQCAETVEALLPNMTGIFVPLDPRSEASRNVCALHFTPKRREFVMFFDALETTSDKALSLKEPPDLDSLSQELEKLCLSQDCPRDNPVPDGYWHVMQYLPDFTVCEKCFGEVVRPRINDAAILARNFYLRPQRISNATCQLYSDRMRDIFRRACRRNDTEYLAVKVRDRARKENEIHSKLVKLDRKGHDSAWTAEQVKKLVEEWKEWE